MKRSFPTLQMIGFIFTGILGTFLHFLFDLSGNNAFVALFSAVNESIWEHLKLLYYPMVLFAVVEYFLGGKAYCHFWQGKLIGTIVGLSAIVIFYYTYTGIFGSNVDWLNIAIFFIAAALAFYAETIYIRKIGKSFSRKIAIFLLFLPILFFTIFTFFPPRIPLFLDPVTNTLGF